MKPNIKPTRRGFTLVEILGAILIVSILAGLLTVGGRSAMNFFRGGNDKATLDGVAKALELYKNRYGEYPPDGTDMASVKRHLLKRDPELTNKTVADLLIEEIDWLRNVYILTFHKDPIDSSELKTIQDEFRQRFGRDPAIDEILEELSVVAEKGQLLTYWLCGEDWVLRGRNRWTETGLDWINDILDYIFQHGESDFFDLNPGFMNPSEVGTSHRSVNYNIASYAICDDRGYPVVYFRANKVAKDGVVRLLHLDVESYEPKEYQNGESFYNEVKDERGLKGDRSMITPYASSQIDTSVCVPYFTELKAGNETIFGLHPYRHDARSSSNLWFAPDTYQLILPGEDRLYVPNPDDPTTANAETDNVTNFCAGATMAEEEFEGKQRSGE